PCENATFPSAPARPVSTPQATPCPMRLPFQTPLEKNCTATTGSSPAVERTRAMSGDIMPDAAENASPQIPHRMTAPRRHANHRDILFLLSNNRWLTSELALPAG